jgi:hypothetical protein
MSEGMPGWWSRWWGRLFGSRTPARPGSIPAPATLVARVESAADDDRDILRVAEESLRRGFPDQAEIAYERAAAHYVQSGHGRKAVAVLRALARLRPEDARVQEDLAAVLESLERRADAARALRAAAERRRVDGAEEQARELVRRARDLELREMSEHGLPAVPSATRAPEEGPAVIVSPVEPDDAPLDLPDEEVNSLVMEALSQEAIAEIEAVGSEEALPSMPGASVHATGGVDPAQLVDTDLDTDREPRGAEDPFEEETPVDPKLSPPTGRGVAIPNDATVYDPSGSAAMQADRAAQEPGVGGDTRVTPNPQLRRLLEAIRKKKQE